MHKLGMIIIILICLFSSCASMQGGLSNYEPAAIVSVTSNRVINWEGEEESVDGIADRFVRNTIFPNQTANKVTQSTAEELIEEAANIVFDTLTFANIAKIVPPADVLETPAYFQAKENKRADSDDLVKPIAYKFINNADKELAVNLASQEGIRSTMYLDFTFNKSIANGIMKSGSMLAKVILRVTLLDETGKRIYFRSREYWSQNRIQVITSAYDNEELMNLFREAIYAAASDLTVIMSKK